MDRHLPAQEQLPGVSDTVPVSPLEPTCLLSPLRSPNRKDLPRATQMTREHYYSSVIQRQHPGLIHSVEQNLITETREQSRCFHSTTLTLEIRNLSGAANLPRLRIRHRVRWVPKSAAIGYPWEVSPTMATWHQRPHLLCEIEGQF